MVNLHILSLCKMVVPQHILSTKVGTQGNVQLKSKTFCRHIPLTVLQFSLISHIFMYINDY